MRAPLLATLLTVLPLAGCHRTESDLPAVYEEMGVPGERLASPDVQRQGRAIFHERCATCHGDRADGKGTYSGELAAAPQNLTDSTWQGRTDERHVYYEIAEGVHGKPMPPWKATLSPGEIWSLVAYIRSLAPAPAGAAGAPSGAGRP